MSSKRSPPPPFSRSSPANKSQKRTHYDESVMAPEELLPVDSEEDLYFHPETALCGHLEMLLNGLASSQSCDIIAINESNIITWKFRYLFTLDVTDTPIFEVRKLYVMMNREDITLFEGVGNTVDFFNSQLFDRSQACRIYKLDALNINTYQSVAQYICTCHPKVLDNPIPWKLTQTRGDVTQRNESPQSYRPSRQITSSSSRGVYRQGDPLGIASLKYNQEDLPPLTPYSGNARLRHAAAVETPRTPVPSPPRTPQNTRFQGSNAFDEFCTPPSGGRGRGNAITNPRNVFGFRKDDKDSPQPSYHTDVVYTDNKKI